MGQLKGIHDRRCHQGSVQRPLFIPPQTAQEVFVYTQKRSFLVCVVPFSSPVSGGTIWLSIYLFFLDEKPEIFSCIFSFQISVLIDGTTKRLMRAFS